MGFSWYHDAPFHAHVSLSSPLAPRPPKRMSWCSCGSKAMEASCRPAGAGLAVKLVQVEPSHTQVALESEPSGSTPPKTTTVWLSLS